MKLEKWNTDLPDQTDQKNQADQVNLRPIKTGATQ